MEEDIDAKTEILAREGKGKQGREDGRKERKQAGGKDERKLPERKKEVHGGESKGNETIQIEDVDREYFKRWSRVSKGDF